MRWRDHAGGAALSVALHLVALLVASLLFRAAPRPVLPETPVEGVIMVVPVDGKKLTPSTPQTAEPLRPRQPAPRAARSRPPSVSSPRVVARAPDGERPPAALDTSASQTDAAVAAPPEASVAVPVDARARESAGEVAEIPWAYLWSVKRAVAEHRHYPRKAYAARQTGTSVIRIRLARDGTLLGATLLRTSGHALLDEEARDVIFRIGRFAPLPERYLPGQPEFAIDQPITFLLR